MICLVVWLAFQHTPPLTFSLDLVEVETLPSHRVLLSRWSSVPLDSSDFSPGFLVDFTFQAYTIRYSWLWAIMD